MKKKIFAVLIAVFLVSGACLKADPGDNAAAFLRIGVGAGPSAMAEAYAGVCGDILSHYYNPAGLASLDGYNFSLSHALWFEDISYSNFVAGMPLLDGYAALGVSGLFSGEIDKYNWQGDDMDDTYSPSDIAVSGSYSRVITTGVSAGAALKFITSEIDGDRASAVALDIGAMKRLGEINLGLSLQNLGTEMKFRDEGDPLPFIARLGASYPFDLSVFNMLAVAETNLSTEVPFKFNAGVKADYPAGEFLLSLRLGVKSYAEGLDALSHLTTGFGVEYSDIVFDYGFASFEDLGLTHRVSLGYRLN